jgi:hypothetical protein
MEIRFEMHQTSFLAAINIWAPLKSDGKSTARNEVGTYNSEQVD